MALRHDIRFKAKDIWQTPDDGNRYEVIDGQLFVTPPPDWGHQRGLGGLYWRVAQHVYTYGLGEVVQAPVGVVLDDENGLEPDLVYVAKGRLGIIGRRGVFGAPDLIVEVLSPRTQSRDRGIKMRRYAAAGVPHYWILNHRRRSLEAFRLGAQGYELTGQRVLDLGTGTGTLARGFALRDGAVTGLDPSAPLLEEARRLDAEAGVTVEYVIAKAEETGLPDAAFDVVSAGQSWHWFDRACAAAEVYRLLQPGGRLVIAHYDWIPLPGNVVTATERLIERHNPGWKFGGGTGVYPAWPADVAIAGFTSIETFSFDQPTVYSHEAWRGRIRASAGVAASLSSEQVKAFDRDLTALLIEQFPKDPLDVPHRVWALVCRKPG